MNSLRFKKLSDKAITPSRGRATDAGFDLYLTRYVGKTGEYFSCTNWKYGTDIAVEIPQGFVGLLLPRSSMAKQPFNLSNCVGVIDSSYRGEVFVVLRSWSHYQPYEEKSLPVKAVQLVLVAQPEFELEEVSELSETDRGEGGFGSTGN